jgi:hypothetical protein
VDHVSSRSGSLNGGEVYRHEMLFEDSQANAPSGLKLPLSPELENSGRSARDVGWSMRARVVAEHGMHDAVMFGIEAVVAIQTHGCLSLNTAATFAGTVVVDGKIHRVEGRALQQWILKELGCQVYPTMGQA